MAPSRCWLPGLASTHRGRARRRQRRRQPSVGKSATQDILAPRPISYPSVVLTDRARSEAAAGPCPMCFDPPDTRVGRQQVLLLRDILDYITSVRADTFASPDQQPGRPAGHRRHRLERRRRQPDL